jgi:copper chaperone CopZ
MPEGSDAPAAGNLMRHTYDVLGMHCQSCVAKVTAALEGVAGVTAASVTLQPPQAQVEMASHVATGQLDRAARAVGDYHVTDAVSSPSAHTVKAHAETSSATAEQPQESLYPLFLIVGYIAGTVALVALATGERSPHVLMRYFMGGFFLVFSFFKLLDLRGFADAYRSYDFLARAIPAWSYAYPFVELALGAAYLLNLAPTAINLATLVLMLVGAAGVLKALFAKLTIRCACLGTALNLPMTKVTLVEDLAMAVMAALALATRQ